MDTARKKLMDLIAKGECKRPPSLNVTEFEAEATHRITKPLRLSSVTRSKFETRFSLPIIVGRSGVHYRESSKVAGAVLKHKRTEIALGEKRDQELRIEADVEQQPLWRH